MGPTDVYVAPVPEVTVTLPAAPVPLSEMVMVSARFVPVMMSSVAPFVVISRTPGARGWAAISRRPSSDSRPGVDASRRLRDAPAFNWSMRSILGAVRTGLGDATGCADLPDRISYPDSAAEAPDLSRIR